ncbi:phosphoribosyltransferase [Pseudomonas sp. gcc21]|uniref:phosphoribosyltransferase n=1 Tax=Pseudomonas sp. gcc21 TaxID=2726989 RepID=UPI001451F771|nr:phosphoribosyltransferase [Pseudomonas sp. gcc21]QJD60352.1 phosphoribosyltransferase [Pseudomonas sp. gcc21]
MLFTDRAHAGQELAKALSDLAGQPELIVLALPRGGVPVAAEVAKALGLPLDILLVRKLGVPGHEEYAMGAIAGGDLIFLNQQVLRQLKLEQTQIDAVIERERAELHRREQRYRGERPSPELNDRNVVLIDDGLATGATMRVAIRAVHQAGARSVTVAVPVGASDTCDELAMLVDRLECPYSQSDLGGVGYWYDDFAQTTDAQVIQILQQYRAGGASE